MPNSSGGYTYQYNLKNHLGNDRLSFYSNGGTAAVLQEDEYYSFGLRRGLYDNSNNNRYLYNGKEIQTDLANQYDYGARFYDPVIGRWTAIDPLVEVGQETGTPYGYVYDDPIKNTDPDGRYPNGPGDDFVEGVKEGFTGFFTGIAHAVTNPGETIKNTFSAEGFKTAALDGVTFGGYSATKQYFKAANAATRGDFKTLGNMVGDKAAEVTTALATDMAFKGFSAAKGAINNTVKATVQDGTNATERGTVGKLKKSPSGKGTAPAAERAKQRVPSAKEKVAEREAYNNECANCGNLTEAKDTRSHHYPVRHADGGTKTVPVCKECHTYLHSGN